MNLSTEKKKDSQIIENTLVVAKGSGGSGRDGLGVWDQQRQTFIQRMTKQQGPPVSTGNYIQYSGIKHNGKAYEKESISMYN